MKFFVTTPIYYVNDQPHIGHAYTTIAADALSLWNRLNGNQTFFLTGTDEHGQKVQKAAELRGLSPKTHADAMVENYKTLWSELGITYDAFIRTTDAQHIEAVQNALNMLWNKGDIVKRKYQGSYCTPCERFWTDKDLTEGQCPDCKREVEDIEEENYFFLMSKYKEEIIRHIEENPHFILPETRRNEVLGFLKSQPLSDLCISRPKKRLPWGIPLPFDVDFVTYVWFDALMNYYSAPKYLAQDNYIEYWPADVHIIGKDILTTHAVYWTAMLMSMGLPLPKTIFAHGWWTINGQKMSKSLGNVISPSEMAQKYGTDGFRYFLLREVPFGHDGDFSEDALVQRINTDLANDFGNLASRTIKMCERYFALEVPEPDGVEDDFASMSESMLESVDNALRLLQFHRALDDIWRLVSLTNKYIDTNAPWALANDPASQGRLRTVLYTSLESLRLLCIYLHPFLPYATRRLADALCIKIEDAKTACKWGGTAPGTRISLPDALFPRIEKPKQEAQKMTEEINEQNLISIDDFMKTELKTGRVLHAERVKKSDKLLRLEVDAGGIRQIVAGIGKHYAPEDLVGKTVVIVANLKPAKLMGIESHGMVLAASDAEGNLSIIAPEKDISPGSKVK